MLWADARGAEFSWLYIQKCLESNIFLVSHEKHEKTAKKFNLIKRQYE